MMKLYYSPGSCSTSCHLSLEESGLKYELVKVDFDNDNDPNLQLINKLNPLGTLPVLITEEGKQLDQNMSIHTYIADKAPGKGLLPAFGTPERAEALNWLGFVHSDLHKSIGGMFSIPAISQDKNVTAAVRAYMVEGAKKTISYMNNKLEGRDYVCGKTFTVADAYAFIVLGWTKWLDIPLAEYKNVTTYLARIAARPSVAKALKEEGLA